MSPLFLCWLLISLFAALGLVMIEAWDYRHDSNYKPVTLYNLLQGACLALVPLVQIFTCIGVVMYFLSSIAPNIVLFGEKKQ
jgi:hypothetical protein